MKSSVSSRAISNLPSSNSKCGAPLGSDSDSRFPSDSSEAALIRAAQLGDAVAFGQLYRLYMRRVYALCLRMVENTAAAEDLTQEIFLTLFRKIHTFRGDSAFSTWLHRIAVNTVLMHFRKNSHPSPSLDELVSHADDAGEDSFESLLPDPRPPVSLDSINLERAIDCLPVKYQLAVILHDVHGYKHNEIAEIAGITVMNSKSILCRARMRLRDILDGAPQSRPAHLSGSDEPARAAA
jgi:RNA polymerase sigma-70 factor, ECF subfamily